MFLSLYIGSSFLFVMLLGFWYYKAQKNELNNTIYYKMQHYADEIGGRIINAEMKHQTLRLPKLEQGYDYTLIPASKHKVFKRLYFDKDGYKTLISPSPQDHLNIQYVIIKTINYNKKIKRLQKEITLITLLFFLAIAFVSWILARLFMRPIHQKVNQIEQFIQDISHELNTPITALEMSSKHALQKKIYDEKILTNISISTKQLYVIYKSLAYLNFNINHNLKRMINLKIIIQDVIKFYEQLCHAKSIEIVTQLQDCNKLMDEDKARLLISNLLSNAIKYSTPNHHIYIKLNDCVFIIKDEGIGISKDKIKKIFELYERATELAGGFGVGLNIVKKICDEENIKIDVSSKIKEGTTFTLEL